MNTTKNQVREITKLQDQKDELFKSMNTLNGSVSDIDEDSVCYLAWLNEDGDIIECTEILSDKSVRIFEILMLAEYQESLERINVKLLEFGIKDKK